MLKKSLRLCDLRNIKLLFIVVEIFWFVGRINSAVILYYNIFVSDVSLFQVKPLNR